MKIDKTEEELRNMVQCMSASHVVSYLKENGLELNNDFPPIPTGIYRREKGKDLIFFDGKRWNRVDWSATGYKRLTWNCIENAYSKEECDKWVRVLDANSVPVFDNFSIQMSDDGHRVG
jgi:hypothetical protein